MEPSRVAIDIRDQADVERARRDARGLAEVVGFTGADAETVVLAVSELATNLLRYASAGRLELAPIDRDGEQGLVIESRDAGPGIANADAALRDGFSTGGGLGLGLGGVRRLMDDFVLTSSPAGTTVVCHKWRRAN